MLNGHTLGLDQVKAQLYVNATGLVVIQWQDWYHSFLNGTKNAFMICHKILAHDGIRNLMA